MTAHGLVTPTHRSIRKYYEQVAALRDQRVLNEMNVRSAFEFPLSDTAKLKGWAFIPELSGKSAGATITFDGCHENRAAREQRTARVVETVGSVQHG
jgi:hypothetical protein